LTVFVLNHDLSPASQIRIPPIKRQENVKIIYIWCNFVQSNALFFLTDKMKVLAVFLAIVALAYCAPQFVGHHQVYPAVDPFGMSGSLANAQSFSQVGGFSYPSTSGSAATAGSQTFTQGGFGGGISGSAANAQSQTFTQGGGFHG
jgi:hypothetical protein